MSDTSERIIGEILARYTSQRNKQHGAGMNTHVPGAGNIECESDASEYQDCGVYSDQCGRFQYQDVGYGKNS